MPKTKSILKVFPNGKIKEVLCDGAITEDKRGRCTIKAQRETICLPKGWQMEDTMKEDSK